MNRHLKTLLKAGLSVLILYLVLRAIDERQLVGLLRTAHPLWLVWAVVWFAISKIIAAYRFNTLLKTQDIHLPDTQQLRLYWLGMYYNLLLPGGISGDGYKIKILMDATGRPFRRLFALTLFDRLSGLLALGQLLLMLAFGLPLLRPYWWLGLALLALSLPISNWLFHRMVTTRKTQTNADENQSPIHFAKVDLSTESQTSERRAPWTVHREPSIILPLLGRGQGGGLRPPWIVALQALAVQSAQLLSNLGLVLALGQADHWLSYSVLFLVSSVAATLPLTIGGTGARELTFLWGAAWLQVDAERAVASAFLFYLISTAVALFGLVFSFQPIRLEPKTAPAS